MNMAKNFKNIYTKGIYNMLFFAPFSETTLYCLKDNKLLYVNVLTEQVFKILICSLKFVKVSQKLMKYDIWET